MGSLPDDPAEREEEISARASRARRPRYVEGQTMYEAEAGPRGRATFVINNDDLDRPQVVAERRAS